MRFCTKMRTCRVELAGVALLCLLAFASEGVAQTAQPKAVLVAPAPTPSTPANWEVNCDTGSEGLVCFARQRVYVDKRVVLTLYFMVSAETKTPNVRIRLPLGIYLPAGASIQFGEATPIPLLVTRCSNRGCYAEYAIPEADIAAMLKGADVTIAAQNQDQTLRTFRIEANGFPAAYAKVRAK